MADQIEHLDPKRIEAALQRAVRQALWEHKQLGHSIVIWRDGKIVHVPPEEINVEKPVDL
ncbi:MAG TPA: hypothetical protein VGM05_09850 [Planctomycetaceae bacterium]|jgi:hypothetical protein